MRHAQYSQAYPTDGGKTKKGGRLYVSQMADAKDLEDNKRLGSILADAGETVHIRPHVDVNGVKNPELELYNQTQIGDFKRLKPIAASDKQSALKGKIETNIKHAAEQGCNIPVLVIRKADYNKSGVIRAFNNGKLWKHEKMGVVNEVWILVENELQKFTREQIALKVYELL